MKSLIEQLYREGTLPPGDLYTLLSKCTADDLAFINEKAREVTFRHFGNRIFIRGLIEVGNCCHNDCLYCGIRRSNRNIERYRLSQETILACCREGYELGFRTFVLQGGEDTWLTDERAESLSQPSGTAGPIQPSHSHWENAPPDPMNASSGPEPTAISCAMKPTTPPITPGCILRVCRLPTGFAA